MGLSATNTNSASSRLTPRQLGWLFFAGSVGVNQALTTFDRQSGVCSKTGLLAY